MHLSVDTLKSQLSVIVEHNGQQLEFSANVFTRKPFSLEDYDVFDHINRYWSGLSSSQQNLIFHVYSEVNRAFDEIQSTDELYAFLNEKIRELAYYHPLEKLELWLAMDPTISIPVECSAVEFIHSPDSGNTREKSYIRKDYMELTAFSLFLRTLVPIWGEYINSTRKSTGVEHKEYAALQLLVGTGLFESSAFQKLQIYIDTQTKERQKDFEKIITGVSSEDMCFLLLSLVCVRRLCLADLRGDPKTNVVKVVYKFLSQRVMNRSEADSIVQEKKFKDGPEGSDFNKRSQMESYKKRTEISLAEKSMLKYAFEDVYGIAERFAPGISKQDVNGSIETASVLMRNGILDCQLAIMSWVFKNHLSPRAAGYNSPDVMARALGVLEAVLWYRGYHYLAVLVTSHAIVGQEEMFVAPVDSRGQIPETVQSEIYRLYPHIWSNQKRNKQARIDEPHPVLHAIDLAVDELVSNAWRSTASEDKIKHLFGGVKRKFPIQPTIKTELAKLVVDVETKF